MNYYAQLLTETLPTIIETEEENERVLAIINGLITKGALSPDESKLLKLLTRLVEDFEEKAYPIEELPPNESLRHILEDRKMKQKDLLPVIGSEGVISELLSGKRKITIQTAEKLADFLGLSSYRILV